MGRTVDDSVEVEPDAGPRSLVAGSAPKSRVAEYPESPPLASASRGVPGAVGVCGSELSESALFENAWARDRRPCCGSGCSLLTTTSRTASCCANEPSTSTIPTGSRPALLRRAR